MPVKALPFVAIVLIGLIAAIASNRLWALDFFHVVGGGLWTGVDLFVGFIVGPILGRLSIPARVEFSTRFMPKMLLLMPTLVICTLAGGWQLARHEGFILSSHSHHGWVVASMIIVGIMAVIALGLLEPANLAVLFELKKPNPDGELDRTPDEALHVHGGDHRRHAGGHADHHDQAGDHMTTAAAPTPTGDLGRLADRKLPPIDILAMVTLGLIIASGIYLAAHLPRPAPKAPVVVLIAVAGVILIVNMILLARIKPFAWTVFWRVAGWSLVAYVVIAGILLFVFVHDHTSGFMLVALTLSLLFFAIDIPLLLAFSVARYQDPA